MYYRLVDFGRGSKMATEVFNRYEIKFMITKKIQDELLEVILQHLKKDVYDGNSDFQISNIYYDTVDNDLIINSIEKPLYKEKFRIRGYGDLNLESMVYLEIKKKYQGLVNKRRTKMTLKEAYDFFEKKTMPTLQPYMNPQVVKELHYLINYYQLMPKLYLGYKRIAFLSEDNSIRITFDEKIITRRDDLLLENGFYGEDLIDKDTRIMEIKVAQAFPLWLSDLLNEHAINPTSFSKYGTEYQKVKENSKGSVLYV